MKLCLRHDPEKEKPHPASVRELVLISDGTSLMKPGKAGGDFCDGKVFWSWRRFLVNSFRHTERLMSLCLIYTGKPGEQSFFFLYADLFHTNLLGSLSLRSRTARRAASFFASFFERIGEDIA